MKFHKKRFLKSFLGERMKECAQSLLELDGNAVYYAARWRILVLVFKELYGFYPQLVFSALLNTVDVCFPKKNGKKGYLFRLERETKK